MRPISWGPPAARCRPRPPPTPRPRQLSPRAWRRSARTVRRNARSGPKSPNARPAARHARPAPRNAVRLPDEPFGGIPNLLNPGGGPLRDRRFAPARLRAGTRRRQFDGLVRALVLAAGILTGKTSDAGAASNEAPSSTLSSGLTFDGKTYTNRLIRSQDPYLLLHAHNHGRLSSPNPPAERPLSAGSRCFSMS